MLPCNLFIYICGGGGAGSTEYGGGAGASWDGIITLTYENPEFYIDVMTGGTASSNGRKVYITTNPNAASAADYGVIEIEGGHSGDNRGNNTRAYKLSDGHSFPGNAAEANSALVADANGIPHFSFDEKYYHSV
jgi:hypothetical protein